MAKKNKESNQTTIEAVESEKSALSAELTEHSKTLETIEGEITKLLGALEPLESLNRDAHLLLSQKKITVEAIRANAERYSELSKQVNLWEIQFDNCSALIQEKQRQLDELNRRLSGLDRIRRTFQAEELVLKIRKASGDDIDKLNRLLQGITPFGQSSAANLALKLTGD